MVEIRSNNNVVYRCAFHVVWCPKYRRPVITGDVDDRLKQLVADDTLSSNARNVKIITTNGAVTLRGPVKDEAEKARVVAIAKNIAGQAPVDVQLEAEAK